MNTVLLAAWGGATLILGGCASHGGNTPPELVGYTESGKASYYAAKYQFRKTASGERFNQLGRTAAHRTLPFDTKLRVTSGESGRSVIVRVNDRGPFVEGRIIDLSRAAFIEIADTKRGVVPVTIQAIP
jgi:rare lipoprotein A